MNNIDVLQRLSLISSLLSVGTTGHELNRDELQAIIDSAFLLMTELYEQIDLALLKAPPEVAELFRNMEALP